MAECKVCNLVSNDISLFVKDKQKKEGVQALCKECKNKKAKKYYANLPLEDKESKVIANRKRIQANKHKAILYKGSKCARCSIEYDTHNACIFDFHHLDPKGKDFNPGEKMGLSWNNIKTEIDKCVLLCANCHRLTHN